MTAADDKKNDKVDWSKIDWEKIRKQEIERMRPFELKLFVEIVSHSESARKYEAVLRSLYEAKASAGSYREKNKMETLAEVRSEMTSFFSYKVQNANNPEEIFWAWVFLKIKQLDIEEILDCVKMSFENYQDEECEYWLKTWGLESFYDFVKQWKGLRDIEILDLEWKAKKRGLDLRKRLTEEKKKLSEQYATNSDDDKTVDATFYPVIPADNFNAVATGV